MPELVYTVNLVQAEFEMGDELVRGPRRPLQGTVREHALAVIAEVKRTRSK